MCKGVGILIPENVACVLCDGDPAFGLVFGAGTGKGHPSGSATQGPSPVPPCGSPEQEDEQEARVSQSMTGKVGRRGAGSKGL